MAFSVRGTIRGVHELFHKPPVTDGRLYTGCKVPAGVCGASGHVEQPRPKSRSQFFLWCPQEVSYLLNLFDYFYYLFDLNKYKYINKRSKVETITQ